LSRYSASLQRMARSKVTRLSMHRSGWHLHIACAVVKSPPQNGCLGTRLSTGVLMHKRVQRTGSPAAWSKCHDRSGKHSNLQRNHAMAWSSPRSTGRLAPPDALLQCADQHRLASTPAQRLPAAAAAMAPACCCLRL
jgi:hypothetical protein